MAKKPKFTTRQLMEKAVEVMHLSVQEQWEDGSPSPLVGAVLLRPDGTIETAARGELREGNHAEFTLLERKCGRENLEGCFLFATLEPCLNRNHPKRGCARHIISARIREVWVGVEDDNPTVAGKGIEHLEQAMVLIPGQLESWLQRVMPSTLDRSRMHRRERVDLPFEMIREAVVNALIHRDYDIGGQKCQLVVNADTITIKSPGAPILPITLEQMQSFSAPMKSRNPVLHYVFAMMGMAEEQGFGLTSLKREAEKLKLPLPKYSMEGDSLVLTIYRNRAGAKASLGREVLDSLSSAEQRGWEWIATKESINLSSYASEMGIPKRTALHHLQRFTKLGMLKKTGSGPTTAYTVIRR